MRAFIVLAFFFIIFKVDTFDVSFDHSSETTLETSSANFIYYAKPTNRILSRNKRRVGNGNAGCKSNQFKCTVNGRLKCRSNKKKCNGVIDCDDTSDEMCFNCTVRKETNTLIHDFDVCNGYFDCDQDENGDYPDERNCADRACPAIKTTFRCNLTKQCIPVNYRCNGYDDCKDKSDELGCYDHRVNPYKFVSSNIPFAIWGIWNMILGMFGNFMTLIAIPIAMRRKRYGLQHNWYSSTIFIVHLAFYDFLFCVFGMQEQIRENVGAAVYVGSAYCKLSFKIVPLIVQGSWYALACVAIATACQVVFQRSWIDFCDKRKAIMIMLLIMIFNLVTSLPQLLNTTFEYHYNNVTGICEAIDLAKLKGIPPSWSKDWLKVTHYLSFTITCVLIFLSYFFIWRQMRKTKKRLAETLKDFAKCKHESSNNLALTIFMVCFCFFIFVFPLIISEAVQRYTPFLVHSNVIIGMYWTQYSVNFIIYGGRKKSFQDAYLDMIRLVFPFSNDCCKKNITSDNHQIIFTTALHSCKPTDDGSEKVSSTPKHDPRATTKIEEKTKVGEQPECSAVVNII